jgi:hypothetical protein
MMFEGDAFSSPPPEKLEPEHREAIRVWVAERCPHMLPNLASLWANCRDYHLERGRRSYSWPATFRRWITREVEYQNKMGPDGNPTKKQRKQLETGMAKLVSIHLAKPEDEEKKA